MSCCCSETTLLAGCCCGNLSECNPPEPAQGAQGQQGETGATGATGADGENSFTVTTTTYVQPAVSANVAIPVVFGSFAVPGQVIFVQTGGYYSVVSTTATTITATNLGVAGFAAPAAVVPTARLVGPAGYAGTLVAPLPIADGGTGQATAIQAFGALSPLTNTGDSLSYSGGANVRIAIGSSGFIPISNGTTWAWGLNAPSTANITGTLPIAKGGTGAVTANTAFAAVSPMSANGDLITRSAGVPVRRAIGGTGEVLLVDSGEPAWGALDISSGSAGITGTLAVANGGTGGATVDAAKVGLLLSGISSTGFTTFGQENDLSSLTSDRATVACDADGTQIVLVVKVTSGDPTPTEGLLVFNTADNTLRLFAGATWLDITFT